MIAFVLHDLWLVSPSGNIPPPRLEGIWPGLLEQCGIVEDDYILEWEEYQTSITRNSRAFRTLLIFKDAGKAILFKLVCHEALKGVTGPR